MSYLNTYSEMMELRGLQPHTLKSYKTYIQAYLTYAETVLQKDPIDITWDELRDFIRYLQNTRGIADRTVNTAISQLRFFTLYVLHKPWDSTQLPYRRFDTYLPFVPTQNEMRTFFESITDVKLKAIVALMYSAGLRVGEVCALRYEDISREKMYIHIRHGKNRSDRYAVLSQTALDSLTAYWFQCGKPKGYLFPNPNDQERPMSTFWVSRHIHEQERLLGWEERFTPHSLRHAFGTHLYENGADLLTIKELLGHKSLDSTTIYVHLASSMKRRVPNPLDSLMENHD